MIHSFSRRRIRKKKNKHEATNNNYCSMKMRERSRERERERKIIAHSISLKTVPLSLLIDGYYLFIAIVYASSFVSSTICRNHISKQEKKEDIFVAIVYKGHH